MPNFDYNSAPSYLVYAVATNRLNQETTFTLTVSIINDPSPPVITNLPAVVSVRETTTGALGGGLHYTECVDEDNFPLTWSYTVFPAVGKDNFEITNSGVIKTTTNAKFSFTSDPVYYVYAFCFNGYYTTTGTLTVVIGATTTSTTTSTKWTTRASVTTTTTVAPEGDFLTGERKYTFVKGAR